VHVPQLFIFYVDVLAVDVSCSTMQCYIQAISPRDAKLHQKAAGSTEDDEDQAARAACYRPLPLSYTDDSFAIKILIFKERMPQSAHHRLTGCHGESSRFSRH
jgi:hypothetical protein